MYPTEIVGKRIRYKVDGTKILKVRHTYIHNSPLVTIFPTMTHWTAYNHTCTNAFYPSIQYSTLSSCPVASSSPCPSLPVGVSGPEGPGECGDEAGHLLQGVQVAHQQGRGLRVPRGRIGQTTPPAHCGGKERKRSASQLEPITLT